MDYVDQLTNILKNPQFDPTSVWQYLVYLHQLGYQLNFTCTHRELYAPCSGPRCRQSLKLKENMIGLSCCTIHLYCRDCLREHIESHLSSQSPPVYCPACPAQTSKFAEIDLFQVITMDEFRTFAETRRGLSKRTCKCNYDFCKFKNRSIPANEQVEFPCKSVYSVNCLGRYLAEFISEEDGEIQLDLDSKQGSCTFLSCMENHSACNSYYNIEEIQEFIEESSLLDPGYKNSAIDILQARKGYFTGVPLEIVVCINCEEWNEGKPVDDMMCASCSNCLACGENFHPRISCEEFEELEDFSFPEKTIQKPNPEDNSSDAKKFFAVSRSLDKLIGNCNLQTIEVIKNSLKDYFFEATSHDFPHCRKVEVFTTAIDDADSELKKNQSGYICLPTSLKNKGKIFVLEFLSESGTIAKTEPPRDLLNEPSVYEFQGNYYYNSASRVKYVCLLN